MSFGPGWLSRRYRISSTARREPTLESTASATGMRRAGGDGRDDRQRDGHEQREEGQQDVGDG